MLMKKLVYILLILVLLVSACDKTAKDAQVLIERGKSLLAAGYPQEALESYQKAFLKDPNCSDAYLQTAILYDDYLNDQTNAINAYKNFLSISKNHAMNKKVQTWILKIQKENEEQTETTDDETLKVKRSNLQSNFPLKDNRFELLKEQLVERYEAKLEVLKNQNLENKEKIIALENENNILRNDLSKKEVLKFVDTISSNENLITNLKAKLEEEKQKNKTSIKSLQFLQNMILEFQNKHLSNSANVVIDNATSETNVLLMSEIKNLSSKLKTLELEKTEFEQNILSNKKHSLTQTFETYSSKKFESLINATNKIVELERKIQFEKQAKQNLINDLLKTQKLNEAKTKQLTELNEKLKKTEALLEKYNEDKNQLEEEKTSNVDWEKLFYDRTVSLKNLKQNYDSLYKKYQIELNKNKIINQKILSIQNELSSFNNVDNSLKNNNPANLKSYRGTYTVKRGDSLAIISRKIYGEANKWNVIYQANRDILNRPNELRIGQKLKIP